MCVCVCRRNNNYDDAALLQSIIRDTPMREQSAVLNMIILLLGDGLAARSAELATRGSSTAAAAELAGATGGGGLRGAQATRLLNGRSCDGGRISEGLEGARKCEPE